MRLELGGGAALLIGNLVVVIASGELAPQKAASSEDGPYIPVQDLLDNTAPCQLAVPDAPSLYARFVVVDGCVAGGHDDLDGDGHLDCWVAQYFGGRDGGAGKLSVTRRCLGEAVTTAWTIGRGNTLALEIPPTAGESLARGIATFVRGAPTVEPDPKLGCGLPASDAR